ncbi:MAG: biopolymer transporter ExbD [Myxococcota bacterium]|nr:biopolymer transporter ExbD [Myxococcota bacterium]
MKRLLPPTRSASALGTAALAPMVDLMTILLVFLLKSYSTDAPVRPGDSAFSLPMSTSEQPVQSHISVDLTTHGLYLEGQRIAGTRYYLNNPDTLIPELHGALQQLPGEQVQIRADGSLPYALTRKALFTAQQAGKNKVTVVTVSRSSL